MRYILLFCCNTIACLLSAQSSIQGKISDSNGEALLGVSVKVGNIGTISNASGEYLINVAAGSYRMECSYVGYETQTVVINIEKSEKKTVDFKLLISQNLLDQLTVTSGRYEKPLGEVTVSMEVLKTDLIERNNTQTIDNVLQKVPGFSIIGGQANIRGGSGFSYGTGTRVLILVDDIPALQADAGYPNWNDFQVETIEQVEVVKGASSALYGSAAMNGVVNIRTAYAKEKPLTTFSSFYTSYRDPNDKEQIWYRNKQPFETGVSLTHRQKFNKLDLVLGTNLRVIKSFLESTYDSTARITVGMRYRITDRLAIGFNSNINFGKSSSYYYWLDGNNGVFKANPTTLFQSKKLRYTIDPFVTYFDKYGNQHKILSRLYNVDNQVTAGNQNASSLIYGEYQFQRSWKNGWVTTAGLVATRTYSQAELYGDTIFTAYNSAIYLQIDKKIGKLNLSAGGRYESNTIHSPRYIPLSIFKTKYDTIPTGVVREAKPVFRLGANYQVADYSFIRASIGQGYRFPTIAEKFITTRFSSAAFVVPNTKLSSETGWSAEIGIKQGIGFSNWKGYIDFAAFVNEYSDMMEFVFVPQYFGFQSQNIGNTRIKGLEATLAGQGKIGNVSLSILSGYTFIDPKYKVFGEREKKDISVDYNILKYRFKNSFKIDAEVNWKGLGAGFALNYNSNIEAIDKVFENIIPGVKEFRAANTKGALVMDFRVSYSFLKFYKFSFILKNASNVIYTLRPALLEAPRNANFRLDIKF
ncbi:MAG: TonB-dependent receptor [Saprospiraceae bacterium]